mgnify:CR=1 FL=1
MEDKKAKMKNSNSEYSADKESAEIEDIFGELKMLGKLPISSAGSIDQEEERMRFVQFIEAHI